jgi:hypothetical protein
MSEILQEYGNSILNESKNGCNFVVIGEKLHKVYYEHKLVKNQREFLDWTKRNLGFSKSTTYEYIISYKVYTDIVGKIPGDVRPPMYQSHCQLLAKVPEEQLADIWIQVSRLAPNGIITTGFLENFLVERNMLGVKKSPPKRTPKKKKKHSSDTEFSDDEEYHSRSSSTRNNLLSGPTTPVRDVDGDVLAAGKCPN